MVKPIKSAILLLLSTAALAQTSAPVPPQFATAHTIYLAPAGISGITNGEDYVAEMYSQTYQMLGSLNSYRMTLKPSDADLAAEISVVITPGTTPQMWATLRLALYDTKTRTLLWTFDAPLAQSLSEKNTAKNVGTAEGRIAADLKSLINGTLPISPAALKTRTSQEKQ